MGYNENILLYAAKNLRNFCIKHYFVYWTVRVAEGGVEHLVLTDGLQRKAKVSWETFLWWTKVLNKYEYVRIDV